jgi:pyruvate carboxylase
MPVLVDTTIRLLGQEPLAGRMPTAELLRLAEVLDDAGFAYLEVSGGGVFDTAVRRGVESPWERIRSLNNRTKTPLAMALRGRFLVGSRPVGSDFVRRFAEAVNGPQAPDTVAVPFSRLVSLAQYALALADAVLDLRGARAWQTIGLGILIAVVAWWLARRRASM